MSKRQDVTGALEEEDGQTGSTRRSGARRAHSARAEETDAVSIPRKSFVILQGIKDKAACSVALCATLLQNLRFGTSGRERYRCNSRSWAQNQLQLQRERQTETEREFTDKEREAQGGQTSHVRHDQELAVWKHGEDGI